MKKIVLLLLITSTLLNTTAGFAGIVDVRFINPTIESNTYCVDVQIRAQDLNFELGSATLFFEYNALAINSPQYTALNFNETNQCALDNNLAPYKNSFDFLEMGNKGEGNYAILLLYPNQGCPTVSSEWLNVANFCFEIGNPAALPDLKFNAQYTAFNTSANTGDQLTIGNIYGLPEVVTAVNTPENTHLTVLKPTLTQGKVWLNYHVEQENEVYIIVYDMAGRVMQKTSKWQPNGQYTAEIDLSKYSNGFYLIEMDKGIEKTSHKVLLAK